MTRIRCPICEHAMDKQGPKEWPFWPFCCKRCKMVDFGRWLSGKYHIESPATKDDLESCEELQQSLKPAVPSADPHREEA